MELQLTCRQENVTSSSTSALPDLMPGRNHKGEPEKKPGSWVAA